MRDYEVVLVVSPQAGEDGLSNTVGRVNQFISDHGGEVTEEIQWGTRRLAYRIRNFNEGTYLLTKFKLDPSHTTELESTIKLSEHVIRHLLIKLDD